VKAARQRAGIPAALPPNPDSELLTMRQAASELGVSTFTVRRWLRDGLLQGEQTTPGAPWRIRLNTEVRARFVPDVPDGFVALAEAARLLGCARQARVAQDPTRRATRDPRDQRPTTRPSYRGIRGPTGPTNQRLIAEVQYETRPGGPISRALAFSSMKRRVASSSMRRRSRFGVAEKSSPTGILIGLARHLHLSMFTELHYSVRIGTAQIDRSRPIEN
jgi:excisionase family DNA binding protein